jgi:predicted ABC-type exoprotein transport system permease subunit
MPILGAMLMNLQQTYFNETYQNDAIFLFLILFGIIGSLIYAYINYINITKINANDNIKERLSNNENQVC